MLVRCRVCGKLNEKQGNQHSVKCINCGETTHYWVSGLPHPPQTPEVMVILRKQEEEDLKKWKETHS